MRVLLINMPWVAVTRPAIGVSLLKAILERHGYECRVAYGNLLFAADIGLGAYELVNDRFVTGTFAGDWLFAQHLFGDQLDLDTYSNGLRQRAGEAAHAKVMSLRAHVAPFVERCLDSFDVASFDVIGFSSTFEQNLASLSLAKLIKARFPEKVIVFGGANCDGVMGQQLHRSFPWIDHVVSGEADLTFPTLLGHLAAGGPVPLLPGIITRMPDGSSRAGLPGRPVQDMDSLPTPNYDDYFEALARTPFGAQLRPLLPIESARGCWWGAKQHCTFCGLNAETMTFRAKRSERVVEELETLRQRHGLHRFMAVDNILPHEYFKTLLPELKRRQAGFSLFYEIKANLKREQVELMRDAGIKAVQPGIESLSTPVLRIMRKGVTGLQNVQMLKLCHEYGIIANWNLLYGFPGELPEHYEETARIIPALYHLQAPDSASPIRLDRFSPNFTQADEFGFVDVQPFGGYDHLYPLPAEERANLAYHFRYKYADGRKPEEYARTTIERVATWRRNRGGNLVMEWGPDAELTLVDTRPEHAAQRHALNGLEREVYELAREIKSRAHLLAHVRAYHESRAQDCDSAAWLDAFLERMLAEHLMLREGEQYLSLAIQPNLRTPSKSALLQALAALT